MMSPSGMAMAALVVMLWILWSDTLRSKRPHPILYSVRAGLFLLMTAVLILNMVRFPYMYNPTTRVLTILAAVVGVAGAVFFVRKVIRR